MKEKIFLLIMLITCLTLSAIDFSQDEEFHFYEYAIIDSAYFVNLVDVNKDGHLDLVYIPTEIYYADPQTTNERAYVRYGDGTLNGLINSENYDIIKSENSGFTSISADLNNDGFGDLVFCTFRHLVINFDWRTPGEGISTQIEYENEPELPSAFTRDVYLWTQDNGALDFNGDGIDDLLIIPRPIVFQASYYYLPSTYIFFGGDSFDIHNPDIEIRSEANSYTENTIINRGICATGDFDGDGIDDLFVTVEFDIDYYDYSVEQWCDTYRVYWGGENFGEEFTDYPAPDSFRINILYDLNTFDLNNNGRTDLRHRISGTQYTFISFDEERNITFYNEDDFNGFWPWIIMDVNGDGQNDIIDFNTEYVRLGEHSLNSFSFSEYEYPVSGLSSRYYKVINEFSDSNSDVLYYYSYDTPLDFQIKFIVLEDPNSIDSNINSDIISPLNLSLYPMPFTEKLNIKIDSKNQKPANIAIYNIKGQKIREFSEINSKQLSWDGKDLNGKSISSGVYFIKVNQDNNQQIKKVLKIK